MILRILCESDSFTDFQTPGVFQDITGFCGLHLLRNKGFTWLIHKKTNVFKPRDKQSMTTILFELITFITVMLKL